MSTKHPPDRAISSPSPPPTGAVAASSRAPGAGVARRRALLGAALAGLAAVACGCSRAPDRALDDADRARLGALLAADAKVDALLAEADRLDRAGRGEAAAALVEGDAARAVTEARALLGRTTPETAWGRARRGELDKLLVDRAEAMPGYAAALRGSAPQAKLDALVAQAAHEKRALALAAAVRSGASP